MRYNIVDRGHWETKFGISGLTTPSQTESSIIGHHDDDSKMICGAEVVKQRDALNLYSIYDRPVEYELQYYKRHSQSFNPSNGVVLTDTKLDVRRRETLVDHFLEKLQMQRFFIGSTAAFSVMGYGLVDGVSVDFGWKETRISTVLNGYMLSDHSKILNLGSYDCICVASDVISRNSNIKENGILRPIATEMFESMSLIAQNFKEETTNPLPITYTLPDNQEVQLGKERYYFGEIYFRPEFVKKPKDQSVLRAIRAVCDAELDRRLTNLVLCGGASQIEGIYGRIRKYFPEGVATKTVTGSHQAAWVGASIVAQLPWLDELHITNEELLECGVGIVHRKCTI